MANKSKWTMNETQKAFMEVLADGSVKSFKQIEIALGKKIATGAVNTLITKGFVKTIDKAVMSTSTIVETRTYEDGTVVVIEKTKPTYETGYQIVA